jgi:hypothetical protein
LEPATTLFSSPSLASFFKKSEKQNSDLCTQQD